MGGGANELWYASFRTLVRNSASTLHTLNRGGKFWARKILTPLIYPPESGAIDSRRWIVSPLAIGQQRLPEKTHLATFGQIFQIVFLKLASGSPVGIGGGAVPVDREAAIEMICGRAVS